MIQNMGTTDRTLRFIIAIALAVAAFTVPAIAAGVWHWVVLAVAVVLALTAITGFCPPYALLGIRTCRTSHAR